MTSHPEIPTPAKKKLNRKVVIAGVAVLVLLISAGVTTKVVVDKNYAAETERLCVVAAAGATAAYVEASTIDSDLQGTFAEGLPDIDEKGGHAYADSSATDAVEAVEAEGETEAIEATEARLSGAEYTEAAELAWTEVKYSFDGYRESDNVGCLTRDDADRVNAHTAAQLAFVATLADAHDALKADYAIWAGYEAIRIEAERVVAEKAAKEEAAAAETARIEAERVAAESSYSGGGNGYVDGGSDYEGGGSSGGGVVNNGCLGPGCNETHDGSNLDFNPAV